MSEIKDMLLKTYLKKGARPEAKKAEKAPELSAKPPKPIPVETPRSLGDLTMAMAAQKIYNPNMPPAPKSPSKAMVDQGTAGALGLQGPWGTPEQK